MSVKINDKVDVVDDDIDGETSSQSLPLVEEEVEPASSSTDGRRLGTPQWIALAVGALVMCAGLFAWVNAGGDESAYTLDSARDSALIAAHQHIETMNTMDYHDVGEGLAAWESATTGLLHDQITGITEAERTGLAEAKKLSSGHVVDAAVLDVTEDTATVLAAVEITVKDDRDPNSGPSVKRNRFAADLVRVDGKWKLENLQQVAVNLS